MRHGEPINRKGTDQMSQNIKEHDRYNGWTNYETWCVHFWQTNNRDSDTLIRAVVAKTRKLKPTAYLTDGFAAMMLQEHVEARMSRSEGVISDDNDRMRHGLARAAICKVNWQEIAENLAEGMNEN